MKRIAVKYGERIYINGRALKVARSKRAGVVNLYVDEDCPVASDAVEVVDCREPVNPQLNMPVVLLSKRVDGNKKARVG